MRKASICLLLSLIFAVFIGLPNAKAQQYTVTDLKTIPPNWNVIPSGINSAGEVVGMSWDYGAPLAFRWTQATGMQSLGSSAAASAVNDAGDITGYVITSSGYTHAFLWNHDGTTQDLGTLGGNDSAAGGINSEGYIVGNSEITGTTTFNAFLWTPQNGMQNLGTTTYFASAINDSGEVVGGLSSSEAFSWTESGGIQVLGAGSPYAINDSGVIVGAGSTSHAQLWRGGTITDLGTLGGSGSGALAVNASGVVVGFSTISTSNNIDHAFIWTQTGGMQDLNPMVPTSVVNK